MQQAISFEWQKNMVLGWQRAHLMSPLTNLEWILTQVVMPSFVVCLLRAGCSPGTCGSMLSMSLAIRVASHILRP
jgi:hypothetical protein